MMRAVSIASGTLAALSGLATYILAIAMAILADSVPAMLMTIFLPGVSSVYWLIVYIVVGNPFSLHNLCAIGTVVFLIIAFAADKITEKEALKRYEVQL
jgi:hypothetical protein